MLKNAQLPTVTLLSIVLFVQLSSTDEVTESEENTTDNTNITINASLAPPTTTSKEVQIADMTRITIPTTYYQDYALPELNSSTPESKTNRYNDTFNPSPQIPLFEFNRYPVPPVYPEAKHIRSETMTTEIGTPPYSPPAPVPLPDDNRYSANDHYSGLTAPTASWSSTNTKTRVNFPPDSHHKGKGHAKEQPPYPFHFGHSGPTAKDYGSRTPHSGYGHELSAGHGHPPSPWKKVIHFLTALLPIGLFLTALTPTVLTVTPVVNNETAAKATRLVDVDQTLIELLEGRVEDSSGCHQTRLLCEAAAKGREPGATNLQKSLWLIASQAYEETRGPKEFMKLFRAIKANKCKELKCHESPREKKL